MPHDDDDDLYDEEFDFVDDDDVEEDDVEEVAEDESSVDDSDLADERSDMRDVDADSDVDEQPEQRSERNGRGRNPRGGRRGRTEARDTRDTRDTREPRGEREPREQREPREEYGSDDAAEDSAGEEPEGSGEPQEDEYGRTAPVANYVVHVYEAKKFSRTIDRPFTPEDAEAFATEFNRTGKNYSRWAVTSKNDVQPKKTLD